MHELGRVASARTRECALAPPCCVLGLGMWMLLSWQSCGDGRLPYPAVSARVLWLLEHWGRELWLADDHSHAPSNDLVTRFALLRVLPVADTDFCQSLR